MLNISKSDLLHKFYLNHFIMLFSEFCLHKSIQQSFLPTASSCNGCLCLQDMHTENVDSECFEACTILP